MIDVLLQIIRHIPVLLIFVLFVKLNEKANCQKQDRHLHFLMPILSFIYCIVIMIIINKICDGLFSLISLIPNLLKLAFGGFEAGVKIADTVQRVFNAINLKYWIFFIANIAVLIGHVILKKIILKIASVLYKNGNELITRLHDFFAQLFYDYDDDIECWYLRIDFGEVRTFAKVLYKTSIVFVAALMVYVGMAYSRGQLAAVFYPVLMVILLGEWYFFVDGVLLRERSGIFDGENDFSSTISNYVGLRQVLRELFGDKLAADNTSVCNSSTEVGPEDLLASWEHEDTPVEEAYAHFMRRYLSQGNELDENYLLSGQKLLTGQSILFNNPFYYDLIPYAFYAMNRTLLQRKKVLIILGRHGAEEEAKEWAEEGFEKINNMPYIWRVGIVGKDNKDEIDVGIVSRSDVHDISMHLENADFFERVEFIVLLEPSKLVTTAQIGLNSIIKQCRKKNDNITFCSVDKNCDGLLDALSHILMVKIDEVTATNKHKGACSYISWEVDSDHLQHRLMPNLARYLGIGTELSFVALKNQVSTAYWFGGDAFPVKDIHWIAKQYYYDLLNYANLPANQESMDSCFKVSSNLWSSDIKENAFEIVEDEDYNMFEIKRQFATRAKNQSFVNMISPNYLLRDYMAANNTIFDADPKAIPYIAADYVRSVRNVVLRLILRMCIVSVTRDEFKKELELVGIKTDNPVQTAWDEFCAFNLNIAKEFGEDAEKVIKSKAEYSFVLSKLETLYYIDNPKFKEVFARDLQNASYIAEDEDGELEFIGPELRAHVLQKYLPGQFFTVDGRYYEMTGIALDGQILARRAADYITGRHCYRQIRNYTFLSAEDSNEVGASREMLGMQITKQFADFTVDTPAYWDMPAYNDFADENKVVISGIPQRQFYNKAILRIDFDDIPGKVVKTITLLMNEVFATLFSENKDLIVALTPGELDRPFTYFMQESEGCQLSPNSIYIVEDSQLDVGLLIAVERNIERIFTIICDYLDWHITEEEESRKPKPSVTEEVPDFTISEEEAEATEKERLKENKKKRGNIFTRFWAKIKALFKRKQKEPKPIDDELVGDTTDDAELVDGEAIEVKISGEVPETIDAETCSESEADASAGVELDDESEAVKSADVERDDESETDTSAGVEPGSESEADASADVEPGSESEADASAGVESDGESEADASADVEPAGESEADTSTDVETEIEPQKIDEVVEDESKN